MKNKRKYKDFPRKYEKVFTSEETRSSFKIEEMSTDFSGGKDDYIKEMTSFLDDVNKSLFSFFLSICGYRGDSFTKAFKRASIQDLSL